MRRLILEENPENFLQWPFLYEIMIYQPGFSELEALMKMPDWETYWRKGIEESDVGNPKHCHWYSRSSPNLIHQAYVLSRFTERTGRRIEEFETVFEIGGGYGSFCRLAFQLGFTGRYLLYDLPEFLLLQRFFLKCLGYSWKESAEVSVGTQGVIVGAGDREELERLVRLKQGPSLFVSVGAITDTPLEFRTEFLSRVGRFDAFLVFFQERFREVDNVKWCEEFRRSRPDFSWQEWEDPLSPEGPVRWRFCIGLSAGNL